MNNRYECVVIGGGVAGSTAAYHLSKLGHQVAVLEKTHGPHHKVCGEFLSFEAHTYLKEMGILLDDDCPVIKYFKLFSRRSNAIFNFTFPGRGISRYKLDEDLLNNAKQAGAEVFRGICMVDYKKDAGSFKIETNKGDLYARHVFMATGKHDYSKEHKRIGRDNSYIGFKTHIQLKYSSQVDKETTVLFTFPAGYAGICPVEGGVVNFCFVIKKAVYKTLHGDFNETIAFLRRSNHELDLVLQEADFNEQVCAVGYIPYGFISSQNDHENVYFLGDQRMVIPSFTGDGMAIALSTAKDCAHRFNEYQKGLKSKVKPMQRELKKQMRWARIGHTILKNPWLVDICAFIPALKSILIETIFNRTRISIKEDVEYGLQAAEFKNNYSRR